MRLSLRRPRWWSRRRPARVISDVKHVLSMNDVPASLGTNLYVVGPRDRPKWVVLACPCDNAERIDVNLMRTNYPRWRLTERNGSVSLAPSLWMPESTCGSHFWLWENTLYWV
jgi:hypothetical protein